MREATGATYGHSAEGRTVGWQPRSAAAWGGRDGGDGDERPPRKREGAVATRRAGVERGQRAALNCWQGWRQFSHARADGRCGMGLVDSSSAFLWRIGGCATVYLQLKRN